MNVAQLVVTGGAITVCGSVVVALIGWLSSRRTNQGNYAKALVEASAQFTDRIDARNDKLEAKVDRLEQHIDKLDDKIGVLTMYVRTAIPVMEAAGHDVAEMKHAIGRVG